MTAMADGLIFLALAAFGCVLIISATLLVALFLDTRDHDPPD